jgi:hypothetical protein
MGAERVAIIVLSRAPRKTPTWGGVRIVLGKGEEGVNEGGDGRREETYVD